MFGKKGALVNVKVINPTLSNIDNQSSVVLKTCKTVLTMSFPKQWILNISSKDHFAYN